MTGLEIIKSSMRLTGVLASGEEPTGAEAIDALAILNRMMEGWGTESLSVFNVSRQTFSLVPTQSVYTMGITTPASDFAVARPARIEKASIIQLSNPSQPVELEIEILDYEKWQRVRVKNITSTLPRYVYIDNSFPARNLTYWSIPTVSVDVALYTRDAITQFATLATDNTYPPGYEEALIYNLAIKMAPEFGVQNIPMAVVAGAIESKAKIKSINSPKPEMRIDPALPGGSGGEYSIFWDETI